MIIEKYNAVFIHIRKTGGTSIEKVFGGEEPPETKHLPIDVLLQRFPTVQGYYKFSFVRNPWDWLVSRYHWSKNYQKLFSYSFDVFIKRLGNGEQISDIAPWLQHALKPQVTMLQGDMDFIGRFEHLQRDFDHVCQAIGKSKTVLPHLLKTKHKPYTELYTPETRDIVARVYQKDIEEFNYAY